MFPDEMPIYRQIADQIKQDILTERLFEEEKVMSTNQYATHFRINPATAQKAFQTLVEEGVLYKKRGIGMFVSTGAREMLQNQHRESFYKDVLLPMLEQARAIGITSEELIGYITNNEVENS